MDAPRRLTDPEADRKLRDLFAQTGPLQAPDDLEARVLHQMVVRPVARVEKEKPLISSRVWTVLVALFATLVLHTLTTPATEGLTGSPYPRFLPDLTLPDLSLVLKSSWTLMGVASAAIFLCLEALLFRTQSVRSDR